MSGSVLRSTGRRRAGKGPVVAAAAAAAVLLLPVPTATAQAAPTAVPLSAEAWYRPLPVAAPPQLDPCTLPTGCLPALPVPLPSPYAEGTLHVGVSGGTEESRTFVELDLSGLAGGAAYAGGTLTLPVATDPQAGTLLPETAALRACLVTDAVQDGVSGAIGTGPAPECTVASPAVFAPAADGAPPRFTVDLSPFLEFWTTGVAALAVLPAQDLEPTATWHVAFSRRDRTADGAQPISAVLQAAAAGEPAPAPSETPTVEVETPTFDAGTTGTPALSDGASFAAPPLSAGQQPLSAPVSPQVAATTASVPVAAVLGGPFAYPAVFLLPLVVAAAVGWAGRAFTRDLLTAPR